MRDIPCPCCGFLTLEGEYGSYAICPICDWEDDPVQLANPTSAGGANSKSLAKAQAGALVNHPVSVQIAEGFRRGSSWRPLTEAEFLSAENRRASGPWSAKAVLNEEEAYWSTALRAGE